MRAIIAIFGGSSVLLGPIGCHQPFRSISYSTTSLHQTRGIAAARAANDQGLRFVEEGRWDEADEAFREALEADVNYAAAHNNLGLVLLRKGKLYEAAMEFRFAGRLDANAREPVVNLKRVFAVIGRATDGTNMGRTPRTQMGEARSAVKRPEFETVNK